MDRGSKEFLPLFFPSRQENIEGITIPCVWRQTQCLRLDVEEKIIIIRRNLFMMLRKGEREKNHVQPFIIGIAGGTASGKTTVT